jgi:hypothetical protein
MDAKGQLLPVDRHWVYSPVPGKVVTFAPGVATGEPVGEGGDLIEMFDDDLRKRLQDLNSQIESDSSAINGLSGQLGKIGNDLQERARLEGELAQKKTERAGKIRQRDAIMQLTNSIQGKPGSFWLKSPIAGTILNSDFRERLTHRYVKASENLLRIGNKEKDWEIELKIPQKHIGQILGAFEETGKQELDVDLLLASAPTKTYRGKLSRDQIGGEATPDTDEKNESEPVVIAYVRIDGDDIPEDMKLPRNKKNEKGREDRVAGTEVHAKVRCGNRPMGYSLFYGVWEFLYEKVIFWF